MSDRIGIRELRSNAAVIVRRAEAGQRTIVTIGGRPVAQLAPVAGGGAERTIDELVAQGLLVAPRRGGSPNDTVVSVWGNLRLDRLLREIRG